METADKRVRVVVTTEKIEAALRRLDCAINKAELRSSTLTTAELRAVRSLKQRRINLRLVVLAREIERPKKVVSLHRWLYGFGEPKEGDPRTLSGPPPAVLDEVR